MRDPKLLGRANEFKEWYLDRLSSIFDSGPHVHDVTYSDEWLSPTLAFRTQDLFKHVRSKESQGGMARTSEDKARNGLGGARCPRCDLLHGKRQCYLVQKRWATTIRIASRTLNRAVDKWIAYAGAAAPQRNYAYRLHLTTMNPERNCFGACPQVDLVITSPPYANRLDYTRLWAPELQLLAAMLDFDPDSIKSDQIGTTVVRSEMAGGSPGLTPSAVHPANAAGYSGRYDGCQ